MNILTNLSAKQLRRAAELKEKITELQEELASYLGGSVKSSGVAPKRKFRMSAAGRARIIAAQKTRWAKFKATNPEEKPVKKGKRTMSAGARAKIAAAALARWARARAAGKKSL